ncbi:MAG: hypothetical protein IT285_03400 [Bdellovibrionales bacterium]|nr:hypothetical protein [Bdellovibrionales bacterium]
MIRSPFIFVTCRVGAAPAVKNEIAKLVPDLRFAFSRASFLTFKSASGALISEDFVLDSIFAQAYGLSIGKTPADVGAVLDQAREIAGGRPLRLHFWERDWYAHGKLPMGYVLDVLPDALVKARDKLASDPIFLKGFEAQPGDLVLDVVAVTKDEWWVGCHRHSKAHSPRPGGWLDIPLPPEAPSRAYLKLEEGLRWSGAPLQAGDQAVEIGSSPGGCSYALLKRGLKVVGIDPREMDPRILAMPGFQFIHRPVADVRREELPRSVQWLMLDMNVSPAVSLFAVDRLVSRMEESLLGVLLTIKLTDWRFANEIPSMTEHLKAMGMKTVRAKQLASNGQEFLFYGLTEKGARRIR